MTLDTVTILSKYIADKVLKQPNYPLDAKTPLVSTGLVDSFSLVDLALFIEDTFEVRIEDSELNVETFDTLSQLSDLIQSRLAK